MVMYERRRTAREIANTHASDAGGHGMRKDPLDDLATGGLFTTVDFKPVEKSLTWLNEEVLDLEDALIEARDREQKLAPITKVSNDSLRETFPALKN